MTNLCQQLIDAVKGGSVEDVERLLEQGADVHCTDGEYGLPPIHRIGDKPSVAVTQLLISHGADFNAMQPEGSPLMMCAYCGYLALAKVLLENGAEVDLAVPEGGETALHMAAVTGKLDLAKLLVGAGADVNRVTNSDRVTSMFRDRLWGETPLHLAAKCGRPAMVEYLLEAGADKNVETSQGKTSLDYARESKKADQTVPLLS